MIEQALQFTRDTFDQFLKNKFGLDEDSVIINRIVDQDGSSPIENGNKVIISLIHVEEETNKQFYNKTTRTDSGNYIKAPLSQRYNLYLLIVPSFNDYQEGLKFLNASIQFFQANTMMNAETNSNIPDGLERLEFEFEKGDDYMQMQNLWTALGAKYQPSLIYKMKLITIKTDQIEGFDSKIIKVSNTVEPEE